MLKPIKLRDSRYKILVYDKYEKCKGLEGITVEVDTLPEVISYFKKVKQESDTLRKTVDAEEFTIDVGDDETNFFQFYDCKRKEYVDGLFEDVQNYVQELFYAENLASGYDEVNEGLEEYSSETKLDVVEGVKSRYTLVSTFKANIGDLDKTVCKTLVVHTDDRMQLLDELQKMIRHDCTNYTLYLNKLGERYFGEATDLIKQLKHGYVIKGKQSANTEAVLQDIREMQEYPCISNGKTPNLLTQWSTLLSQSLGEVSKCVLNVEGILVPQEDDHYSDTDLYANVIELASYSVSFAKQLNLLGLGKHSSENVIHLNASERFDSQADDPMLDIKLQVLDYVSTPVSEWTEVKKENLIKFNKLMKEVLKEAKDMKE
ncbi:MAG: hypothetical protein ABS904_00750 [Solibacillus isronensis]